MVGSPSRGGLPASIAVCLLVVMAGCAGVFGGDRTPTPTDNESQQNGSMPPGINGSGLSDGQVLLAAHRTAMAEAGFAYTVDHRTVATFENGTTSTKVAVTSEVRATAGLVTLRKVVDHDAPIDEQTAVWTNGTAGYRRVVTNGTHYERYTDNPSKLATTYYLLPSLLEAGNWTHSSTTAGGDRVVLVSTGRLDGRLEVDSKGRIRLLNVTQVERKPGADVTLRSTIVYEVTAVGNVSVAQPDWVKQARNATG